jgi:hypothetical protein
VSVDWRDPAFREPRRISVTPTGVHRRTILMESPDSAAPEDEADPERRGELSPEQLRELADLEEARRAGQVSESEYQARRREILESN